MEELRYNTTKLSAHEQTMLNKALVAVLNQDDVHDGLM
jgi:hypothetical protein